MHERSLHLAITALLSHTLVRIYFVSLYRSLSSFAHFCTAYVLLRVLDGRTALMMAAFKGHAAIVKLFIEAGADKDAKKKNKVRGRVERHAQDVLSLL